MNTVLAEVLMFEDAFYQDRIDRLLLEADGTENKSRLGANAVLGVSLAVASYHKVNRLLLEHAPTMMDCATTQTQCQSQAAIS